MLSATILVEDSINVPVALEAIGISPTNNKMGIYSQKGKELATIKHYNKNHTVELRFSGNLRLEEYEIIHNAIITLASATSGKIDDTNSLLGYLGNAEPAYIVTNWVKWTLFLNEAKYKTLEGQKVKLLDVNNEELASGILVDYQYEIINDTFSITECTLITTFGERKYTGDKLKIEPTDRW